MQGFAQNANRAVDSVRTAFVALGGALSIGAFVDFIKHAMDAQDEILKLSQKTGIAVAELSAYKYALGQSDVSLQDFSKGVKSLAQKMTEANDATSKSSRIMATLGVDLSKGAAPAIERIAETFAGLPDGTTKATLAVELFGKSGMEMIPFLNQGAAGIRTLKEEAARMGLVMGEDAAKNAEKFNDNLKAIKASSERLGIEMVNNLGDSFVRITDAMKVATRESGILMAAWVALGGIAAEALGLNTDPVVKRLREVTAEMGRLQAMINAGPRALGGGIFDRAQVNQAVASMAKLREEMKLLKAQADKTWNPQEGGAFDFGGKLTSGSKGVSEQMIKDALATEKLAKARKDLADADAHVVTWMKAMIANAKLANDEVQRMIDLDEQARLAKEGAVRSMRESVEELEFEVTLLGKSNAQRQEAILLRNLEKAGIDTNTESVRGWVDRMRQAIDAQEQFNAQSKMWDRIGSMAGDFFSDLVMNGKSAFDNLKRMLKQLLAEMISLFAKRWILNMAAGGTMLGSAGQALAGGPGSDSLAGAALNWGGSALGLTGTGGSLGLGGAGVGASMWGSLGAGVTATETGTVLSTGALAGSELTGAMSGIYTTLASIPVWGWIAMAVIAIGAFIAGRHKGGPKVGGSFFEGGAVPGTDNGRFFTPSQADAELGKLVGATSTGFLSTLKTLGGTSGKMNFGLGFDHDPSGTAQSRVSSVLTDETGKVIYSTRDQGMDDKEVPAALQLETQRMILAALQQAELPKEIADILNSIVAAGATSEQIMGVIAQAREMKFVLDGLAAIDFKGLDVDALKAFAREGESLGQTFQRIAGVLSDFDNEFMTDAQKIARASAAITKAFGEMGLAIPANKQAFYDLVHGLDLSTEAGRKFFEQLMAIAPAFAFVANSTAAMDDLGTSADQATQNVKTLSQTLMGDFMAAQKSLGKFLNDLMLDPNLSPLSYAEKLAQAQKAYEEATGPGKLKTAEGIAAAQEAFKAYLELAKQTMAGPAYTAIVQGGYDLLGKTATGERPFTEAFNAALPRGGERLASGADIDRMTERVIRAIGAHAGMNREDAEGVKRETRKVGDEIKNAGLNPVGARA